MKFYAESLAGKEIKLRNLEKRIILKRTLKKLVVRLQAGFV
jgi:hypothetical protein